MSYCQRKCSFTPEKKKTRVKRKNYYVFFLFQHSFLRQAKLPQTTVLHVGLKISLRIRNLIPGNLILETSAPDFGSRHSPTESQERN